MSHGWSVRRPVSKWMTHAIYHGESRVQCCPQGLHLGKDLVFGLLHQAIDIYRHNVSSGLRPVKNDKATAHVPRKNVSLRCMTLSSTSSACFMTVSTLSRSSASCIATQFLKSFDPCRTSFIVYVRLASSNSFTARPASSASCFFCISASVESRPVLCNANRRFDLLRDPSSLKILALMS